MFSTSLKPKPPGPFIRAIRVIRGFRSRPAPDHQNKSETHAGAFTSLQGKKGGSMRRSAALATACLLLAGLVLPLWGQLRLPQRSRRPVPPPPAAAQDQQAETTIKVDVNLVSFPVTVTDGYGRFVASLRRENFQLFEDGVSQGISLFHNEIVPVSVGIVIDTSGSMVDKIRQAADALEHFVNTIQPDDDVFLMRFAGTVELELDFTGNRELFSQAAHRLQARGATRLYNALAEAIEKVEHGRHRKRAILLITDGNDTSSQMRFDDVLDMARQSEVLIYSMGIGHDERGSFGHGRWRQHEDRVDMRVLEAIADASGGRAFHLEAAHRGAVDMIDQAAQQVSAELRRQYTIGYYPSNTARDGSYRRIELRTNTPGVQVRHRRGYYSARDLTADVPARPLR